MIRVKNFSDFGKMNEANIVEVPRLHSSGSISVWGDDKSEQKFRDAFPDSIDIPKLPETGDVTYDGNKIGFVDGFSGLVFTDVKWIETHIDKINDIIKKTGFWYG